MLEDRRESSATSCRGPCHQHPTLQSRTESARSTTHWNGRVKGGTSFISRVSVFDAHSAAVYLTEKTDVAFRPFGLDLFDQLVRACKAIRLQLEKEQHFLGLKHPFNFAIPNTGRNRCSKNCWRTSLRSPSQGTVKELAHLSAEEESRLALLEKSLVDLQASDPRKLTRQLTLRGARVQALARHFKAVEAALSAEAVEELFNRPSRRATARGSKRRDFGRLPFRRGCWPGQAQKLGTELWGGRAPVLAGTRLFRAALSGRGERCALCTSASRISTTPPVTGFSNSRSSSLRQPSGNSGGSERRSCNSGRTSPELKVSTEDHCRNTGRHSYRARGCVGHPRGGARSCRSAPSGCPSRVERGSRSGR